MMCKRARKLIGPMARGSVRRLKIGREMPHRLERILLRNPDQGIRIVNPKMSFHGIVEPWKAQDLYLAAPVVDIHMTVESPVQQHVSRLCTSPSGEAGLR